MPTVAELVPVLQTAIGPVILISGVGLLLLTMTNRLGRVIDRARILASQVNDAEETTRQNKGAQLVILWRRARLIRLSITLTAFSALFAAILVVVLFLTAILRIESAWLIGGLFILDMASLIGALIYFLQDINLSLEAVKIEIQETGQKI
jgi:Protein of unknown function (DUF2721)